MAAAEVLKPSNDRSSRPRGFGWLKKLTNRKHGALEKSRNKTKTNPLGASSSKEKDAGMNEPPQIPSNPQAPPVGTNGHRLESLPSFSEPQENGSLNSLQAGDGPSAPSASNRSTTHTLTTNPDTIRSDGEQSKEGLSATVGGKSSMSGGGNSIFSSSNHSSHSLTTTLTTIHSGSPSVPGISNQTALSGQASHQPNASQSSAYFTHQYPSTPATAVPAHLNPHANHHPHPLTYRSATANNLLTDNASIITLASSNRQNRRNSLDEDASIRAIAPSSMWGGSRESLPLSFLSQQVEPANSGVTPPATATVGGAALQGQRASIGSPIPDRASAYSSSNVNAPNLGSAHNSIYGNKTAPDGASVKGSEQDGRSVKSSHLSHGRNDSTAGSIGGYSGHLTSPKE